MIRKIFAVTLLAGLFAAAPARAQLPGLEIEPYIGVFVPGTDVIDEEIAGVDLTIGHQQSFAVGGRLTLWLLGPLGLEGNIMYAFSDVEVDALGFSLLADEGAHVWAADARLLWNLLPLGPIGLHLSGGLATINHGGDFYDLVTDGESSVGGVVGGGLRVKLPGLLGVRADADAYLYSIDLAASVSEVIPPVIFDSQFQVDFVLSAGLILSIGP